MVEIETKKPVITVKNVYKIYKQGVIDVVALKGLSCKFYPGEISILMGPSGCGKSTLINLIAGIDKPNSGEITIENVKISSLSKKEIDKFRNQKIGIVFQFNNLIPQISAFENISLSLYQNKEKIKDRKSKVMKLLNMVGMQSKRNHTPLELSGGEQQKIAIATALATNPQIILFDEPTGELDSDSRKEIYALIKQISSQNPNTAFIIVTHDHSMKEIADKLLILSDGKINQIFKHEDLKQILNNSNYDKTPIESNQIQNYQKVLSSFETIKGQINSIEKDLNILCSFEGK